MEITVHNNVIRYFGSRLKAPSAHAPLVFVHGAAGDHATWAPLARWFVINGYSACLPDLPGHGASEEEPLSSIEALGDWLLGLLDALAIERAIMIGHSMGSLAVLEAAARRPGRVSGLALVGSAFPMRVSGSLLDEAKHRPECAWNMMNNWSFAPSAYLSKSALPGFYLPGLNLAAKYRSNPKTLAIDFSACNNYSNGLVAAAAVSCPALLLCGERDLMTPPHAVATLADKFSQSQTVCIPNAGHMLMFEKPLAVLQALRQWLVASAKPTAAHR